MTDWKNITGRIIRILDEQTVVINLGTLAGIEPKDEFKVLGVPESVIDPETEEVLGSLSIVKARLRASRVYDRFTVAKSKWTTREITEIVDLVAVFPGEEVAHGGDLRVDPEEIQPWRATSEEKLRIGDLVEATVPAQKQHVGEDASPEDHDSEGEENGQGNSAEAG